MDKKLFYMVAVNFALRAKAHDIKGEFDASIAYRNAFDMMWYAYYNREDCLEMFDWMTKAKEIVEDFGTDVDLLNLEEKIYKGEIEK